jgi:mitochondrial fission protein ELM1
VALVDPRTFSIFQRRGDQCRDATGMRSVPERVVLDVAHGVDPSPKPPVRIFLGTEPAQYRAERIFVYSIERVRDPARVYEIHLMKELAGFDRRLWLTGFTNYRYAIPYYAGGAGKAIWNDVDEIYLSDPARLFDLDMEDHGILTVPKLSEGARPDSSVMLIDCAQMAPIWPLRDAQRRSARKLLDRAQSVPGICGPLRPEWNARDAQYVEGQSHLIHYTALHTQPWQPLPARYVYQRNPVGDVWHDLERAADRDGYSVFTARRPSAAYRALRQRVHQACRQPGIRRTPAAKRSNLESLRELVSLSNATTLLDVGFAAPSAGPAELKQLAEGTGASSAFHLDFCSAGATLAPPGGFDGVICSEVLEYLPDEDVDWFVEELFAHANRFVHATVSHGARAPDLPDGTSPRRLASGGRKRWYTRFENASARHPGVHWKLVFDRASVWGHRIQHLREGGRPLRGDPVVWVLSDGGTHDREASQALAGCLGWATEVRNAHSQIGSPPWPDLVIGAGRRPCRVARKIGQRSRGRSRVVEILGPGGRSAYPFDLVVTHGHSDLPRDRYRIETLGPLTAISGEPIRDAQASEAGGLAEASQPRVVLLIGPASDTHPLSAELAWKRAEQTRALTEAAGGSLFAVTTCDAEADVERSLCRVVGAGHHVSASADCEGERGLIRVLALADVIVVCGNNRTLIAKAAAIGKPLYIYPVPEQLRKLGSRIARWVDARAHTHPFNRRGTERPQKHLEYLCARLIERGIVAPPPNLDAFHRALVDRGIARHFSDLGDLDGGWPAAPVPRLREAEKVAEWVRSMLGRTDREDPRAASRVR